MLSQNSSGSGNLGMRQKYRAKTHHIHFSVDSDRKGYPRRRELLRTPQKPRRRGSGRPQHSPEQLEAKPFRFRSPTTLSPRSFSKKCHYRIVPRRPVGFTKNAAHFGGGSLSEVFTMPLCGNDSYILDTQTIILVQVCARYIHVNFGCD